MRHPITSLFCVLALAALVGTGQAADAVKKEDLPAPVLAAMEKASHSAELSGFEKSTGEDGKVVYTAKYTNKKGKEAVVTVGEDGKVVKKGGKDKKDK